MIMITKEQKNIILFSYVVKILYEVQVFFLLQTDWNKNVSYLKQFNMLKIVIGYVFFSLFVFILVNIMNKEFEFIFLFMLFLIYYLPVSSTYGINNTEISFYLLQNIYFFMVIFFYLLLSKLRKTTFRFSFFKEHLAHSIILSFLVLLILLIVLVVVVFTYTYNKFNFNFNIGDAYLVREESRGIPTWFSWIKQSMGNIGIPLLLSFCVYNRKIVMTLLLVVAQICLFSIGMDKSYFISALIGIVFPLIFNTDSILVMILKAIVVLFLFSIIEFVLFGSSFLFFFVVRRTFYIQSWMSYIYFLFFTHNSNLFFTQEVFLLSKYLPQLYQIDVLQLINNFYFHGLMPSPNSGMFSEAFMHLGPFSVFIFPFILSLFIMLLGILIRSIPMVCKLVLAVCFSSVLVNIPILSGYFVSILVFTLPLLLLVGLLSTQKNKYFTNKSCAG